MINETLYANDKHPPSQFVPAAGAVAAFLVSFGIKWNKIEGAKEESSSKVKITETDLKSNEEMPAV